MTQQVNFNGHIIEFPDGMSAEDMAAAIKKNALSIPKYDPSAGGSSLNIAGFDTGIPTSQGFDRFMSGAGKAVSDLGSGIGQLYAHAADAMSPNAPTLSSLVTGQPTSRSAQIQADIDAAKLRDKALMSTGAGMAGNIAGNVAMTVLPGAGLAKGAQVANMARTANAARAFVAPTSYLGAFGAGATTGALQPVASDESRMLNVGAGALAGGLGQGMVNTLGRIAQPVQNALDPVRQKAIDTLKAAGVPLNLAQLTGSPTWNRISSALGDNLFTMGGQAAKQAQQKAAFTNAALGTIGTGGSATSDVMGAARDRINGVFSDVLNRNNVQASPSWLTPLTQVHSSALENEKQPVVNVINRIFESIDPQTGAIPGQLAYGIKKDLDRMAMTQDSTQKYLALQAKSALMDGINGSLSGADQQAFAQARGQFANMMKLEPAIAKDGTGDISAPILANTLAQKANRGASIYGQGPQDLVDLAQAGKQVLGDKTPNSGTASRVAAALLPGAVVAGGTQLATGDSLEALKYGAGVFALPKVAQYMLNSPGLAKYLSEGIQPNAGGGLLGSAYNAAAPTLRGLLEAPTNDVIAGQIVRSIPSGAVRGALLPAGSSYEDYLKAFSQAPDKATKVQLGNEWEALQSPALQ